MIRVDINETFTILAQLIDEETESLATGRTVYYDIRDADTDAVLSPPVSGTLTESTVETGLYKTTESISIAGQYLIYTTASGFLANSEELIVNSENIYNLTKQNRYYNIAPEDVERSNAIATASQTVRNVPLGYTDYVITKVRADDDNDWDTTTVSGVTYAWYASITDTTPYRMGDNGL